MVLYIQQVLLLHLMLFLLGFSCVNRSLSQCPQQLTFIDPKKVYPRLEVKNEKKKDIDQLAPIKKDYDSHLLNMSIQDQILNFSFEDHILKLREKADQKRGISWKLEGDILVRDVVAVHDSLYAAEDYIVQIMNIYRAAQKMYALYGEHDLLFVRAAIEFMDAYHLMDDTVQNEKFWIEKLQQINDDVASKVQQKLFPKKDLVDVNQKLRLAENYVGLDDAHYSVTTTFKIGEKQFALEDKKWLKLTDKQKLAFRNRKSEAWYNTLDEFEQKFVDGYLDKFLDGAHYIPTQIRNLPGCRNAYQKRVISYNKAGQPTVLGSYYHSGALASLVKDKEISEEIAENNWEQLLAYAPNLEVICLNNRQDIPIFDYVGEKHIVDQTQRIVGDDAFLHLPINILGSLTQPIFKDHVQKLLKEAASFHQIQYKDLSKYLVRPFKVSELNKAIERVEDEKNKCFFSNLSRLKEAAEAPPCSNIVSHLLSVAFKQTKYSYADLVSLYVSSKTVLEKDKGLSTPSFLFSCKSGKDRTGFVSYLSDVAIIRMTYPELDTYKVYKVIADASHPQFLSSLNGGMPGRFGMKPVSITKDVSNAEVCEQLFPAAALRTKDNLR